MAKGDHDYGWRDRGHRGERLLLVALVACAAAHYLAASL
jgi:hypothetical protein